MAMVSENTIPRIMFVSRLPDASGLRPIACSAPFTTEPMPTPAPSAPTIARPAPSAFIPMTNCAPKSGVIYDILLCPDKEKCDRDSHPVNPGPRLAQLLVPGLPRRELLRAGVLHGLLHDEQIPLARHT